MLAADVGLLELGAAGIGELSSANMNFLRATATTASKGEGTKLKLHKDCRSCTLGFLNCSREYVVFGGLERAQEWVSEGAASSTESSKKSL